VKTPLQDARVHALRAAWRRAERWVIAARTHGMPARLFLLRLYARLRRSFIAKLSWAEFSRRILFMLSGFGAGLNHSAALYMRVCSISLFLPAILLPLFCIFCRTALFCRWLRLPRLPASL